MTNIQIRADPTMDPEYYIDFARGSVYHSATTSRGHINRIFNDTPVGGNFKHLSHPQATDFYNKTRTAEFYLIFLRSMYCVAY